MKKAIAIIGFVLAVLVFSSCELQKGGTIKVTNKSGNSVNIYITKGIADGLVTPPDEQVAKKTIAGKGTGEISIGEDGTYYVRAFYLDPVLSTGIEIPSTKVDPTIAVLLAGNTVSVTVDE